MEIAALIPLLIPTWSSVAVLFSYLGYLALAGSLLPGKIVPGAVLSDGTRLRYSCNGLLSLFLLMALLGIGVSMELVSPTVIADKGLELLSVTFIFSILVSCMLYVNGCKSLDQSSSFKPHVTGNLVDDWWLGVQLNPRFMGIDLKWDIIAERLGFMLVFGDLVFIPFTFTIQA